MDATDFLHEIEDFIDVMLSGLTEKEKTILILVIIFLVIYLLLRWQPKGTDPPKPSGTVHVTVSSNSRDDVTNKLNAAVEKKKAMMTACSEEAGEVSYSASNKKDGFWVQSADIPYKEK